MAIAFNAVTNANLSGGSSDTFAHTTAGSDRIVWVSIQTGSAGTPLGYGLAGSGTVRISAYGGLLR